MSNQYLTSIDVARRLNCSTEWVRRMANAGVLSAERTPSGQRIFRASEVEVLALEREQQRQQRQKQQKQAA